MGWRGGRCVIMRAHTRGRGALCVDLWAGVGRDAVVPTALTGGGTTAHLVRRPAMRAGGKWGRHPRAPLAHHACAHGRTYAPSTCCGPPVCVLGPAPRARHHTLGVGHQAAAQSSRNVWCDRRPDCVLTCATHLMSPGPTTSPHGARPSCHANRRVAATLTPPHACGPRDQRAARAHARARTHTHTHTRRQPNTHTPPPHLRSRSGA